MRAQETMMEVTDMAASYEKALESIRLILKRRYKLTLAEVEQALSVSPLKTVFEQDLEMAAHTSNEAWARDVYDYWKAHTGK